MPRCVMDVKAAVNSFDGYKRHVLRDLDIGVVRAIGITPAKVPESTEIYKDELKLNNYKILFCIHKL